MSEFDVLADVNVNDLIIRVREGDQQAFSEMLNRYNPLIDSLVSKFCQSESAKPFREDLRQESVVVFYNAILAYDAGQTEVEFGLYARICISNALVSQIRAINRRSAESPSDSIADINEGACPEVFANPYDEIVDQENLKSLYSVIKKNLSDLEYIIWHNYTMGRTAKEIAVLLDKNERSISNAIYRIRKKLRNLLK